MDETGSYPICEDCPCWRHREKALGDIVKQKPEVTYNTNRTYPNGKKAPDGIEVRFGDVRPTAEVREMLKDHGYRFSEKQKIWYAKLNPKTKAFAEELKDMEVDVDTTQYEKLSFWAKVKKVTDYAKLYSRTEFMVSGNPPQFFYNKKILEKAHSIYNLIDDGKLSFKKYYNKVVGEDEEEAGEKEPSSKTGNAEIAEKLEGQAESLQKQIDAKLNSAMSKQRPTPRRMRIVQGMREEGYQLQETQNLLYALAKAHRSGTAENYPYLKEIRKEWQLKLLKRYRIAKKHNWSDQSIQSTFDDSKEAFEKLGISTVHQWALADVQMDELLHSHSPEGQKQETEKQRKISELEMQIVGSKIPGFFPTPKELIERLIDLADLNPDQDILEPSAGKGDILDAIREKLNMPAENLYACEINPSLREILTLKNYTIVTHNFLEVEDAYDRIIMNPPFENGQDIDHVLHAFEQLKHGGRVVAIMGEGVFFRQFKKDTAFRNFLKEHNAYISEPIKEAFKNGFNSTGVNVRIVAINDDSTPITPGNNPNTELNNEEEELMELQAQAELELLRMRVEQQRKKNGLEGIGEIDLQKLKELKEKALARNRDWNVLDFN
ncbi:MAG: hypothetical protein ACXVNM_08550 [Bacteroidia bacterium]